MYSDATVFCYNFKKNWCLLKKCSFEKFIQTDKQEQTKRKREKKRKNKENSKEEKKEEEVDKYTDRDS